MMLAMVQFRARRPAFLVGCLLVPTLALADATTAAAGPVAAPAQRLLTATSVGRVHLGMTLAAARRALGATITAVQGGDGPSCLQGTFPGGKGVAAVISGRLVWFTTGSPVWVTSRGIHVGSTLAAVHAAYPAVRPRQADDGGGPELAYVVPGSGRNVIDIVLSADTRRVTIINVGPASRVIDAEYPCV